MSFTLLIAIYGAIVATVSIGFNIVTYFAKNIKRANISALGNMQRVGDSKKYLLVSIINTGDKVITLSAVGYTVFENGKYNSDLTEANAVGGLYPIYYSSGDFPYKLERSDKWEGWVDIEQIPNFNDLVDRNSLYLDVHITEPVSVLPRRFSRKVRRLHSSSETTEP